VGADADDHVAQVVEGVDAVQLACSEQRVEDAGALRTVLAPREEPVLAADRDAVELPLGDVV
jgi:hypothetical protein